jgi:histidinol-phosphate aminotransferase
MDELPACHGGTDSLPEPRFDFSSNANALGPCPSVLSAIKRADLTRYPDPRYWRLREQLAAAHGTLPERVIVGSGASELIVRLVRYFSGAVQQLGPTFSEYAHGARLAGRRLCTARSPKEFLRVQRRHPGVGFLCWPNNPTGDLWETEFIEAAVSTGPLVLDLAYAPMCEADMRSVVPDASRAYRLYSPNKSFGLTGVRGAYLIAPRDEPALTSLAPSWVIGRDAVALLEASVKPAAERWLKENRPQLHRWRRGLAKGLQDLGVRVQESPASFLLAEVGKATRLTAALRQRGLRVRDATSFGLNRHIRLSAQAPAARRALLGALKAIL